MHALEIPGVMANAAETTLGVKRTLALSLEVYVQTAERKAYSQAQLGNVTGGFESQLARGWLWGPAAQRMSSLKPHSPGWVSTKGPHPACTYSLPFTVLWSPGGGLAESMRLLCESSFLLLFLLLD